MILVHSKQKTPDEIVAFARRWRGEPRLVVVPTAYPDLTEARIRELGNIVIVIYGKHAVRAAVIAMREVFAVSGPMAAFTTSTSVSSRPKRFSNCSEWPR